MLGLGEQSLRTVPVDKQFRLDGSALRSLVAELRLAAKRSVGTARERLLLGSGAVISLAGVAFERGLAGIPRPDDLGGVVRDTMFSPDYPTYA